MAPSLTEISSDQAATMEGKTATNGSAPTAARHEEYQYLDLVREILETGEHRPDR